MIGFFDSGVGGLSILEAVERILPNHSTVYLADTAHFPYGTKTEDEVRELATQAIEALRPYDPTVVVVACNTASTSALPELRNRFPAIPIVGVVPALKPAVALSKTKRIALLATERTLHSAAYQQLKDTFGSDVHILDQACGGWVELVEAGHIQDERAERAVRQVVEPLVQQGVDTFVLGCTHYPFLRPLIQRYAGAGTVLDSGEAVAQQVERIASERLENTTHRQQLFLTTGTQDTISSFMKVVLGRSVDVQCVA